jgi:hypothetical protein
MTAPIKIRKPSRGEYTVTHKPLAREIADATEVQRANLRSWEGTPISMPPRREGRGDGFDAVIFPRFGSIER